jgi:hypothetical protein
MVQIDVPPPLLKSRWAFEGRHFKLTFILWWQFHWCQRVQILVQLLHLPSPKGSPRASILSQNQIDKDTTTNLMTALVLIIDKVKSIIHWLHYLPLSLNNNLLDHTLILEVQVVVNMATSHPEPWLTPECRTKKKRLTGSNWLRALASEL